MLLYTIDGVVSEKRCTQKMQMEVVVVLIASTLKMPASVNRASARIRYIRLFVMETVGKQSYFKTTAVVLQQVPPISYVELSSSSSSSASLILNKSFMGGSAGAFRGSIPCSLVPTSICSLNSSLLLP